MKGHVPVAMVFKPRATALRALHIRKPPELARDMIYGPLPPPPDPSAARAAAEEALAAARAGKTDVQMYIDKAYARWANLAEEELMLYSGKEVKKAGERARLPRLVWRSIVPERAPRQEYPRAAALAWLRSILGELTRAVAAAASNRAAAVQQPPVRRCPPTTG